MPVPSSVETASSKIEPEMQKVLIYGQNREKLVHIYYWPVFLLKRILQQCIGRDL